MDSILQLCSTKYKHHLALQAPQLTSKVAQNWEFAPMLQRKIKHKQIAKKECGGYQHIKVLVTKHVVIKGEIKQRELKEEILASIVKIEVMPINCITFSINTFFGFHVNFQFGSFNP